MNTNNNIFAWGGDEDGQLGDDVFPFDKSKPVEVDSLTNAVSITAGHSHSLALLSNSVLAAWGSDTYGQSGIGFSTPLALPVLGP